MSTHGITVRWIREEDFDQNLLNLVPIDISHTTSEMLHTVQKMQKEQNYFSSADNQDKQKQPNLQTFKTIVVEHSGQCVAMGSFLMREFTHQTSVNVGHFMVNKRYPGRAQLIHILCFTMESLAWAHNASYVVINP